MAVETLDELLELTKVFFPYTEENYPGQDFGPDESRRTFAVKHGLTHLTKSVGKIAAIVEANDHGAKLDEQQLRIDIAKVLMTTLNMAQNLGMSGEALADLAIASARGNMPANGGGQ